MIREVPHFCQLGNITLGDFWIKERVCIPKLLYPDSHKSLISKCASIPVSD